MDRFTLVIFLVILYPIVFGFLGRALASYRNINPVGGFLAGLFLGPLVFLILLCKPMKL